MTQSIGSIRVRTGSIPDANATTGAVKISVNPNNAQRVQSINYLPVPSAFFVRDASDVQFDNTANNLSILTYDNVTEKFIVQNAPRINGGTF
jgi:hypothetical protein